jgi:hypothetical protein
MQDSLDRIPDAIRLAALKEIIYGPFYWRFQSLAVGRFDGTQIGSSVRVERRTRHQQSRIHRHGWTVEWLFRDVS